MEKRKGFDDFGAAPTEPEPKRSRFSDVQDVNFAVEADYFVEQRLVGWIIGRGGNTLKEIEASYQVKVSLDQAHKDLGYSQLRIAGPQIMVTQAADHINMSLARAVATTDGADSVGPFLLDSPPVGGVDTMHEEVNIDQRFVGWLLGKGGGVIREIELQSGCKISINQDTRASGFSKANLHGNMTERLQAKQLIEESIGKAMESPAGAPLSRGGEEEVQVEQKWIGWLLGRQGGVIKEIEQEFGVRISIDQSTKGMGFSTVKIGGDPTAVAMSKDRIQGQLQKVGGVPLNALAGPGGVIAGATTVEVNVEQHLVGWLLGKSGSVMKEIEIASGAKVSIKQDTKHLGYSVAQISGHPNSIAVAKSMVEEKLLQVYPGGGATTPSQEQAYAGYSPAPQQARAPLMAPTSPRLMQQQQQQPEQQASQAQPQWMAQAEATPDPAQAAGPQQQAEGNWLFPDPSAVPEQVLTQAPDQEVIELQLEQKFVGWILGKAGATLREIEAQSGAGISIDQTNKHIGHSVVKIVGGAAAVLCAQKRIQASLSMASGGEQPPLLSLNPTGVSAAPNAASAGSIPDYQSVPGVVSGLSGMPGSSPSLPAEGSGDMQVEQRMVGWLVGTRGAVMKEMETQSGARISIDQSTKELGYSTARIAGLPEAVAIAQQLISEKIAQAHPSGPPGSGSPPVQASAPMQFGMDASMYSGQQATAALLQGFLQ